MLKRTIHGKQEIKQYFMKEERIMFKSFGSRPLISSPEIFAVSIKNISVCSVCWLTEANILPVFHRFCSRLFINCSCNNLVICCFPLGCDFFWLSNLTVSCSLASVSWYLSTIDWSLSSFMLYFGIFSRPVFFISSLKWCTSSLCKSVMAVPGKHKETKYTMKLNKNFPVSTKSQKKNDNSILARKWPLNTQNDNLSFEVIPLV